MPKKTTYTWRILLIRAKAVSVGTVEAPDEKSAIQKAIKDFHITDREQQKRFVARRE
jgi:hypothetical protein